MKVEERDLKLERKLMNTWYQAALKLEASDTDENLNSCWVAFSKIPSQLLNRYDDITRKTFAIASSSFYNKLAQQFYKDYVESPLLWEECDGFLFTFIKKDHIFYVFDYIHLNYPESQISIFFKGFEALLEEEYDVALHFFNKLVHYHKYVYISEAYFLLDILENAMRSAKRYQVAFKKDKSIVLGVPVSDFFKLRFNLYENNRFLLYAFTFKGYYKKAISTFHEILDFQNLEEQYAIADHTAQHNEMTDFREVVTNVSIAYDQTNQIEAAIAIVKDALVFDTKSTILKRRLQYLTKRQAKTISTEKPLPMRKTKRAFNIQAFKQTELISTEKTLEDMIIEQIKYGHKVFNKNLEVYQDDTQYGRQLYVEDCGRLDLLLVDKENDSLIVVELKRNKSGIEVYDQTIRYMTGLKKQFNRQVQGIICLHQPTQELIKLTEKDPDVTLFTYHFDFKQLA